MSLDADETIPLPDEFATRFDQGFRPPCQLYVVSPPAIVLADFVEAAKAAFDGGPVAAFQLRLKDVADDDVLRACEALLPVCAAADVAFLLNDRADLAAKAGVDGVHLGQSDGSIAEARKLLGAGSTIGRTCHDSRHLAMEAGEQGADYVAFGAFYDTTTKPSHYRPTPPILGWWTTLSQLPCVAIGGIFPEYAAPLVAAGADFIAVVRAVWDHPAGPGAGVAAFAEALATPRG
ncbi:thiamine-phosphate pyrophosphorylase [Polymorphobacter multimanifer]|uniref:Thiamine-phosphate synthase n=1 Tax=Polymorphobacter multimanifer TaxID=1070431 RepID=A0A841LCN0_9SPHN|nr:thiamine phosphate synthase [Polymorphobacter multimanifer]MBB6226738.1 thiamine-phosphate pyrophosphorylase [Polymorphobacter multimanifer]